jgi:hypothetical protein
MDHPCACDLVFSQDALGAFEYRYSGAPCLVALGAEA